MCWVGFFSWSIAWYLDWRMRTWILYLFLSLFFPGIIDQCWWSLVFFSLSSSYLLLDDCSSGNIEGMRPLWPPGCLQKCWSKIIWCITWRWFSNCQLEKIKQLNATSRHDGRDSDHGENHPCDDSFSAQISLMTLFKGRIHIWVWNPSCFPVTE